VELQADHRSPLVDLLVEGAGVGGDGVAELRVLHPGEDDRVAGDDGLAGRAEVRVAHDDGRHVGGPGPAEGWKDQRGHRHHRRHRQRHEWASSHRTSLPLRFPGSEQGTPRADERGPPVIG
jgi:hypothetical protein